ncbi:MAG: DUF4367 domain-containing protein [Acetobacter sp.]|nr:DUF4367 domain-containing protein [Bacteroides sp.]MCM1342088.1 DUF4367 domain-containing protein [Acetobacter sp.]MCM1434303.1 DUF4367 domain-containing protein [Clostridiales bacterium]
MNNFNDACTLSCDDWLNDFSDSYDYEFTKSFEKEMNRLIDKMRKDKYHKLTRKSVQTLIIAAIILSFATTAFAIPSSRKYIIKQFKDHFSYSVVEIDDVESVESIIVGYIPEGFKKTYEDESQLGIIYEYKNNKNWFSVSKDKLDTEVNFDSLEKEYIIINDTEYLLFTTDGTNGVIWNNGLYTYSISGNINKNELIKIAVEVE